MEPETKEIITCACCGCVIDDDAFGHEEAYRTADGDYICEECFEREYSVCDCCGEVVSNDDIESVDHGREYVCCHCRENTGRYFYCDDCGEWYSTRRNHARETSYGTTICDDCYSNNYGICDECRDYFLIEDLEEDDDGNYVCGNCMRSRRHVLHNYGYKPNPIFKTVHDVFLDGYDGNELMFGVELEIDDGENRTDCVDDLTEDSEDVYCKTDGSLHEGIEIVTHPCTLEYHRSSLGWKRLIETARKYNFSSHNTSTCGLHVHVGTYQMGNTRDERMAVKAKLVMLVTRHWNALVKFSRRQGGTMGRWSAKPSFSYDFTKEEAKANALNTADAGRYQAVNLTNRNTVEFRLFRGSLVYGTIMASIELVNNFTKYAMTHSIEEVMKSQWEEVACCEKFEELDNYLVERELTNVPGIPPCEFDAIPDFKIGDAVKVLDRNIFSYDRFTIGMTGVVVSIDKDKHRIGVNFNCREGEIMTSLGGRLKKRTGRWINERSLSVIDSEDLIPNQRPRSPWIYDYRGDEQSEYNTNPAYRESVDNPTVNPCQYTVDDVGNMQGPFTISAEDIEAVVRDIQNRT